MFFLVGAKLLLIHQILFLTIVIMDGNFRFDLPKEEVSFIYFIAQLQYYLILCENHATIDRTQF